MSLSRSSIVIVFLALTVPFLMRGSLAADCGVDADGALCPGSDCCSRYGFCGDGDDWCGAGCQSGPCYSSTPSPPAGGSCGAGVGGLVSESQFNSIFPSHIAFYSYSNLIDAANTYGEFGTDGDCTARTREIAAFFAHISHETGGLTKINEDNPPLDHYCDTSIYPCASGKQYYGRGPLQLSWNYNYAQCGDAIGVDLLNNPDLVATDSSISFEAAIWFWQTAQSPKPSCHAVITGSWSPSSSDAAVGRQPGFGMTINIINGGLECGSSASHPELAQSRIDLYNSICATLGVSTGDNVSCSGMSSYPV